MKQVLSNWKFLTKEIEKDYFKKLKVFLKKELDSREIYPEKKDIFKALELTSFEDTRVVILGQNPYHTKGVAHGLAFSSKDVQRPPSLRVVLKEISKDALNVTCAEEFSRSFVGNDLTCWAEQGVLLLNTSLTVVRGNANSHLEIGWEKFTASILKHLWLTKDSVVFVLWGKKAQESFSLAMRLPAGCLGDMNHNHMILRAAHPASELYGGSDFSGCKHFSKINKFLIEPIDWRIKN